MEKISAQTNAIFQRSFLSIIIVISNVFSWYFPLYIFFNRILEEFQMGHTILIAAFGIQFGSAIVFAIIGTKVVKKFPSRNTFLSFWMSIGVVASILMITLNTFNISFILLTSFLLGFSLGLGLPSCLAYFGDYSTVENRGLFAGIIFFVSGLSILFIGIITSYSTLVVGAITLALWRGIGLLLFLLVQTKDPNLKEKTLDISYRTVLFDRNFLLYFIPWIMFSMINFLETPIIHRVFGGELISLIQLAEFGLGGVVALVAGRFADSVGRKRVIMSGFIMLGIGYATLGFFQGITLFQYAYIIIDGVAWGIFFTMFLLVIWSELAGHRTKEKYYLIGLVPFLIASYSLTLITPYVQNIQVSTAFSLASFFLFIAVLPLLYAPETMPEKNIELKRLKKFADDAKKMKEKYEQKTKE